VTGGPARRGAVPGLASPAPVTSMRPGVYLEDDLLGRFVSAFDDALAPVFLTLDTLECYVDPWSRGAHPAAAWDGAGRRRRGPGRDRRRGPGP
jgi:hypothetical protein